MNQMIKSETVDFKKLVNSTNTNLNFQSKLIDELNNTFTENEQKWYIANLYVYLNYHPTNDFPVNLDDVYKLIGFSHKKNAKRTLTNNFTENEDYKITVFPREHGKFNNETIMLNVDTFKNICMITKTEKAKEIRKYYVKLENIFNKLIHEEHKQHQLELQEKDNKLIEQKEQSEKDKEKTMFDLFPVNTQCVYFGTVNNKSMKDESLIKFGITNDLKRRINEHKKVFDNFKLVHVYKVANNLHIENEIKKYQVERRANMKNETKRKKNNRLRTITLNLKHYTEMLALNDEYNIEYFHNMIMKIIEKNEYNIINYNQLQIKYKEMESENKKLKQENDILVEKNDKLIKDLEYYKPKITLEEKLAQKNTIGTLSVVQGIYLYAFECNQANRFKIGMCRLSELEELERIYKMSDQNGSMKYHVKITNPFFDKIFTFLLKKELLNLGSNLYDGRFEEIKYIMDNVVLIEKLFLNYDFVKLHDILTTHNKLDNNITNDPEVPVVRKSRRSVDKINKETGEIIETFNSIVASAKSIGVSDVAVGIALRNRTLCKGFLFKYSGIAFEDSGKEQPVVKINCSTGERTYYKNMAIAAKDKDASCTYVALRQRILTKLHVNNHHWEFDNASHYNI
jgi:phage anti-repressor protein